MRESEGMRARKEGERARDTDRERVSRGREGRTSVGQRGEWDGGEGERERRMTRERKGYDEDESERARARKREAQREERKTGRESERNRAGREGGE